MYEVLLSRRANKAVGKLLPAHRRRLRKIVEQMTNNPLSFPYRKIQGEENTYRICIGGFRILFELHKKINRVIILKIDKRSKAYR